MSGEFYSHEDYGKIDKYQCLGTTLVNKHTGNETELFSIEWKSKKGYTLGCTFNREQVYKIKDALDTYLIKAKTD